MTSGIWKAATPLLLWAAVFWRVPKAVRSPRQRPLTVAFLALAVVMTLGVEGVARTVDDTVNVAAASTLFKHLSGLVAASAVIEFIAQMAGEPEGRRARRIRHVLAVVTGIIMSAAFPFLPRSDNGDFLMDTSGSFPAPVYWGVWLMYLATALGMATNLCWKQARQAPAGRLRLGLGLVGSGTAVGLLYVANQMSFVLLHFAAHRSPFSSATTILITNLLLNASLLLILTGTTLPAEAVGSAARVLGDYRALWDLYPLWKALSEANPTVVLGTDVGRHRSLLNIRDTRLRLYRRVIEIRDCALALQEHTPAGTEAAARGAAQEKGLSGPDAEAFVDAFRLASALNAKNQGISITDTRPDSPGDMTSLSEEVRWLRMVSQAFLSPDMREIAQLAPTDPVQRSGHAHAYPQTPRR
ncbi:MAB_1171c family putative transporter [Streptomyces hygroscopicus]|uniref:MAB_1171c family putative transporter n=1 Tax=Streptomyces hygroscopicus TaxID=1912 RepID=UPI002AD33768|nr:MAB_1171c family putative transporter [Streptomyces hygroscopicus]